MDGWLDKWGGTRRDGWMRENASFSAVRCRCLPQLLLTRRRGLPCSPEMDAKVKWGRAQIIIMKLITRRPHSPGLPPPLWASPLCGNLCIPCADNKFGSKKIIQNDITETGTLRISISG